MKEVGNSERQETGCRATNRRELPSTNSKARSRHAAVPTNVHNHFNQERALYSRQNFKLNRAAALAEWSGLLAP
jgi:putative transposase